ncbi:unnamed protein product [Bathycoccus prasinos]
MGVQDDEKTIGSAAERAARFRQYEYKANASLVLQADKTERRMHEPSGMPESLWGRIDAKAFGDRVKTTNDDKIHAKKKKTKNAIDVKHSQDSDAFATNATHKKRKKTGHKKDVLSSEMNFNSGYKPKTRETRAAYEVLLKSMTEQFGEQPSDVLRGAAEEVLETLKDTSVNEKKRKEEVESLVGELSEEKFAKLVAVGKMITDFTPAGQGEEGNPEYENGENEEMDDDVGVAVEFEESDEDDSDDDDDGDGGNRAELRELRSESEEEDSDDDDDKDEEEEDSDASDDSLGEPKKRHKKQHVIVRPSEIDAYYLQRLISNAFSGSSTATTEEEKENDQTKMSEIAEKALQALEAPDDRSRENELVRLLEYDKFDLVKTLMQNRDVILWCTKLSRAQSETEKQDIENLMSNDSNGALILSEMKATRASARERQENVENKIREEAKKLRLDAQKRREKELGASAHRKVLELDALAFHQGSRLMANAKCELPEGSFRTQKKGYEEVHVPAMKAPPFADNEKLRPIEEIPEWARPAFKGMKSLNRVQSRVYETALLSPENMLLCAPTGAGKTNVAVLTICHEIGKHLDPDTGEIDLTKFKIVYVAPMKALVAEVVGNLSERLKDFGVNVRELTGDVSMSKAEIEDTQIIVSTPEKWDIITRKSGDRAYTQSVSLLIVDEVHLLHDGRGPVLESIIARTIRQVEETRKHVRFVGLSATLPNYDDVAAFARVDHGKGLFVFDNSYRPCPLQSQFIGITVKKPLQRFQLMNEVCYEKVDEQAGQTQVMVFVHSRKETYKTAKALRDMAIENETIGKYVGSDTATAEILRQESENVKSNDLKELLRYGFAIHHAGMVRADRTLVEELFADGHIQVLVSTATLAWGVNLPAHTVIIKGTQVYNPEKGGWDELSFQDVMQMMGRAGRPQFDTFGEGIIITQHTELQYYLSLFNQQLPIESQFVAKLADSLNAEIVLGSIASVDDAVKWLGYTYLFVRMLRNPVLYGVPRSAVEDDPTLSSRRADLVHSAALSLDKAGLIRYDKRGGGLQATDLGRIASQYYVSHGTVKAFHEHLKPQMGDIELCRLFSLAEEFKFVTVRQEEKIELATLAERVPIPVKESIEESTAKINILLQAYISNMSLEGFSLSADMVYITQSAGRLLRCIFEIVLKRGWAQLCEKSLNLCKMAGKKTWSSQTPLRQFKAIPNDILMKIERKDVSWEQYFELTSQEIGELIRFPKMGKAIHKFVHQFPRMDIQAHVQPITRSTLKVDVVLTPDFVWDQRFHSFAQGFWIMVEDNDGEKILHSEYFTLKYQNKDEEHSVSFTVPLLDPIPPQYFIRVTSDAWLGGDTVIPVSFKHLLLPEKFAAPTELLDLQPIPIREAQFGFAKMYSKLPQGDGFKLMNPIQTQTYQALTDSDESVYVSAPAGSGKSVCAELAILRAVETHGVENARCVYCAPIDDIAEARYADWKVKFEDTMGIPTCILTGDVATDLKLLERSRVIVSSAKNWDILSRRWKQRKNVQKVKLFIADALHLIGGAHGATIEVACSRMRYVSVQKQREKEEDEEEEGTKKDGKKSAPPIRILGLSASVANAKDLAEWLGVNSKRQFNFAPSARPTPLRLFVRGFDVVNYESRVQAMSRPTYRAIKTHCEKKEPAIVFAPTRKHAKQRALELLSYALNDNDEGYFRNVSSEDENVLEQLSEKIESDAGVKHAMTFGIAVIHEGLSKVEKEALFLAFECNACSLMICEAASVWTLRQKAKLVVVSGTQLYDAGGSSAADYPVVDVLQMTAKCGRPGADEHGTCVLMCSQPKKAYYSKFLHEPFPVESHLDHFLHDHFNAEIVTRTIETKQDAVDYLTWTYYYRRLTRNPNYYNLTGTSHRHVSDALSELVESTLSDLEVSKCAQIEDDDETGENEISPLNLGMIASYYYAQYTTVELFAASLTAKTKLKGILEIVSGASEFDSVPIRPGEAEIIRRVLNHSPIAMTNRKTNDPHVKTCALLQAHLSRVALPGDLARDLESILPTALRLLLAMVDVISSNGWLSPAMCAMELSQMLTQAMWDKDAGVLQLPHVTKSIALKAKDKDVESVYELLDAEDSVRGDILSDLSKRQLSDVAKAANRYPNVDCEHKVTNASQISTSSTIDVEVNVSREWEFGDSVSLLPPVNCSRYPIPREESWWVVVGDEKDNRLCAIKRVNLVKSSKVKLSFASPSEEGKRKYALYFMCDSYLGADLEFEFDVAVAKGEDEEEEDDSSEEEDEDEDEKDDAGKEKDAPDAVMKD